MAAEVAIGHEERGGESSKRYQPCGIGVANLRGACPHADLIVKNRLRKSDDLILGLVGTGCIRNIRATTVRASRLLLSRMRRTPIGVRWDNGVGGLPKCDRRGRQKTDRT